MTEAILDTGVFIRLKSLRSFGDKVYVTSGVASEIRDVNARKNVELQLAEVNVVRPSSDHMKVVKDFARLTGDLPFLSGQDLEFLAGAVALHTQRYGADSLNKEPQAMQYGTHCKLDWIGPKKETEEKTESDSTKVDEEEEEKEKESNQQQGAECDAGDANAEINGEGDNDAGDDDEGDWITADNVHRIGVAVQTAKKDVVAVSTDYSVQNVLLQLGIQTLTIDGFAVSRVKIWGLVCRGCRHFTRDTSKIFCPGCGNATVQRVPIEVSSDGSVTMHYRPGPPRLRGMKYSIPKPKGGRNAQNLILCEDQLLMGNVQREHRHQVKQWEKDLIDGNPFCEKSRIFGSAGDPTTAFGVKTNHMSSAPRIVAGYGRANPNSGKFQKSRRKK